MCSRAPTSGCTVRDDRATNTRCIAVQGPEAVDLVDELLARAPQRSTRFASVAAKVQGIAAHRRAHRLHGRGRLRGFHRERRRGRAVARALRAAGTADSCRPGSARATRLRLEAALPLYGHELGEDISPYEARLGLGGQAQPRGHDRLRGSVVRPRPARSKRRLVGLVMDDGIAREGCAVLASGARIGKVTSGTHGPSVGRGVALALLDRDAAVDALAAGTPLEVEMRGRKGSGARDGLPFYVRRAPQAVGAGS